jgi:hypothetical protein
MGKSLFNSANQGRGTTLGVPNVHDVDSILYMVVKVDDFETAFHQMAMPKNEIFSSK